MVGKASSVVSGGSSATVMLYSAAAPGSIGGPEISKPSAVGTSTQPAGAAARTTSAGAMPVGSCVLTPAIPTLSDSAAAENDSVIGPAPAWAPSAVTSM